jgi:lysophospholipase L1-like esterase
MMENLQEGRDMKSKNEPGLLAAFGDSLTAGVFLAPEETYLHKLGKRYGMTVLNAGIGGNTSSDGVARMQTDVIVHRPQVCIVAFGMNDQVAIGPNTSRVGVQLFQANLIRIAEDVRRIDGIPVLCTIHPVISGDPERYYYHRHPQEWYLDGGGVQGWIDRYSEAVREVARATRSPLADIAAYWNRYTAGGGRVDTVLLTIENSGSDDGVHTTPEGQNLYAACIAEQLDPLLACP